MRLSKRKLVLLTILALAAFGGGGLVLYHFSPQKRLARHIVKGRISLNAGQFGTALTQYGQALAIDPTNELALVELGQVRLAMEEPERAAEQFEAALTVHPQNTRALSGLVRARLAQRQPEAALAAAQRLLALGRTAEALTALGDVHAAQWNEAEADAAYREAQALSPDDAEAVLHLATFLRRQRRTRAAATVLENYAARESARGRDRVLHLLADIHLEADRPEAALACIERALTLTDSAESRLNQAQVLLLLNRPTEARAAIEPLFEAAKAGGKNAPVLTPAAYRVHAATLLDAGELDMAWQQAQVAQRGLPDDPQLALLLARIHAAADRAQQARMEVERALLIAPSLYPAQDFLLALLSKEGRPDEVLAAGRPIVERTPRNEVSARWLARAAVAAGRVNEMAAVFDRARPQLLRGKDQAVFTGGGGERGETPAQTVERLQKLVAGGKTGASIYYQLAEASSRQRDVIGALRYLEEAVTRQPEWPEARLTLGRLRLLLGQPDLAAPHFEAVLARHADDRGARASLARVRSQQKRFAEAAALHETLLDGDTSGENFSALLAARLAANDLAALEELAGRLESHATSAQHVLGWTARAAALIQRNQNESAVALLDRALNVRSDLAVARLLRGRMELRAGRAAEAVTMLKPLCSLENPPEGARLDCAAALWLAGDLPAARALAAEEYLIYKRPDSMLLLATVALDEGQTDVAVKRFTEYSANLGITGLDEAARAPEAKTVLRHLVLKDIHARAGLAADAARDSEKAMAAAPSQVGLRAIHALALIQSGQDAAGDKLLAELVEANPTRPDFLLLLAERRNEQQRGAEAFELFRRAQEVSPEHSRVLSRLGTQALLLGRHREAARHLEGAVRLSPRDVVSLNNLVWTLAVELKSPAEAAQYAETLQPLAPFNASVLDTVGWTYFLNNEQDKALRVLAAAAALSPDQPQIAYHHGMALLKDGKREQALEEFRRAHRLGQGGAASFPGREENERLIAELAGKSDNP